jgi:hypothetical protein
MCAQCMAAAMTTGAAATGVRAGLAARSPRWLTPRRLRSITVALVLSGVIAAGVLA